MQRQPSLAGNVNTIRVALAASSPTPSPPPTALLVARGCAGSTSEIVRDGLRTPESRAEVCTILAATLHRRLETRPLHRCRQPARPHLAAILSLMPEPNVDLSNERAAVSRHFQESYTQLQARELIFHFPIRRVPHSWQSHRHGWAATAPGVPPSESHFSQSSPPAGSARTPSLPPAIPSTAPPNTSLACTGFILSPRRKILLTRRPNSDSRPSAPKTSASPNGIPRRSSRYSARVARHDA